MLNGDKDRNDLLFLISLVNIHAVLVVYGKGFLTDDSDQAPRAVQQCANVKHFFTLLGKKIFTLYGKEFFTLFGKQFFT